MDAKKLMVDDWVLLNGVPKQVMETLFGSITIDCYPIEECYIEPIPLTSETLEKNGFKYNPFGTGFYECKTEEGNIACTKTDYWLFYINDNIIPNHFYYIHELQHALKLCGIEKNIKL